MFNFQVYTYMWFRWRCTDLEWNWRWWCHLTSMWRKSIYTCCPGTFIYNDV